MTGLEILGLVLLILAFVFIGIECLIPGFGAPGIAGVACLIVGVALSVESWKQAMILSAILAVAMAIFIFIMLKLLNDLRPAGKVSVDDLVLDVISGGPFIEKGASVKITGVSNSSLVVKKIGKDE